MGIRIILLAMLLRLGGVLCEGSSGDYLIDVWRGDSGLPSSSVTTIAQTLDGYLWAGTYNGLVRFDGVRFIKYDPDNISELKRARVRKLYLDEAGTLWINTYDGSLTSLREGKFALEWLGDGSFDSTAVMVSGKTNRIVFLLHTGALIVRRGQRGEVRGEKGEIDGGTNAWEVLRPPGMSTGSLCAEDGEGVLWGRGRDQRLWRYRDGGFELMATNLGLQGGAISCLATDHKGGIWLGTDKEVAKWDGSHFENMTPTNGEANLNVAALYITPAGETWIVANERVRKAQGRQWVYEAEACANLFPRPQERLGIKEDRNGAVWVYHYGRGLFHIRRDGQTRQLDMEEDFPGERVDCFFEDREGNIWCGVDRGGLVRLRQKRFVALIPPERILEGQGRSGAEEGSLYRPAVAMSAPRGAAKAAVSVAEDETGATWIGTYGGGLYRLFDGEWQRFPVPSGARRSFVFSLCPTPGGSLWLSAGEEDLFCKTGREIQQIAQIHGVKCLLAGSDGRIWVGNKSGLWVGNRGQFRLFRAEEGIRRTDVRALAEDSSGAIWVGAGDGMLYRIATNKVESFQANDSLGGQPIWSLYADAEGALWIGTFRGGLVRYKDKQFVRYTSKDGLPDDVICQILEDDEGRLWIGCQQGIFSVAKTDLNGFAAHQIKRVNCTAYGRYDGLPSLECSGGYQPAAWRTKEGRLLFSTLGGVVSLDPEDLAPNRLPPPVVIEELVVNGQTISSLKSLETESPKSKVQSPKPERQRVALEIAPGKRQLEFRYTGLSFVSPDRVRFRYKLEGLDKDYTETGTHRSAQYNYLPPREYTFHVQACNNDGVWNEQGAALTFRLLPYFYETWWFRVGAWAAAAALAAAIAWQIVARRMRRKMRDLERQQAIERDRARIAQDIHDDLGAGLTQIMLLSELARREPAPEVQNHLGQISDMARGLTRKMDEIVWAVDPQHDTLTGFMDYASAFTEEFLRVAGLRCRMDLPPELPKWPMDAELRYNLFLALKEALNNVVKHAHATEVRVGLRLENNAFTLVIQDNGVGMGRASGKAIVEKEDGQSQGVERESAWSVGASAGRGLGSQGEGLGAVEKAANGNGNGVRITSGNGLLNMERRLRSVGGECVMESANGNGTKVAMRVRVKAVSSPIVVMAENGDLEENKSA